MRTFEIGYKAYYQELKEWHTDNVRAMDKNSALKTFARRHRLNATQPADRWRWWEEDWLMVFAYIKSVNVVYCPSCSGTGVINVST
jgi:hypothetical protein